MLFILLLYIILIYIILINLIITLNIHIYETVGRRLLNFQKIPTVLNVQQDAIIINHAFRVEIRTGNVIPI